MKQSLENKLPMTQNCPPIFWLIVILKISLRDDTEFVFIFLSCLATRGNANNKQSTVSSLCCSHCTTVHHIQQSRLHMTQMKQWNSNTESHSDWHYGSTFINATKGSANDLQLRKYTHVGGHKATNIILCYWLSVVHFMFRVMFKHWYQI